MVIDIVLLDDYPGNLLQRLGDSLEQDAGALRRLWQSYGVSGRSRAYMQ